MLIGNQRSPICTTDPVGNTYLVIPRIGVSGASAESIVNQAGLTVIGGPDSRVTAYGPVSAAGTVFGNMQIAAVYRVGKHDVVDSWGEVVNGVCASRSLVGGTTYFDDQIARDLEASFVSVADCTVGIQELQQTSPIINCNVNNAEDCLPKIECNSPRTAVWSGRHTLKDYPQLYLANFAALHKAEWDANCATVRWLDGHMHIRAGTPDSKCWWRAFSPTSTFVEWNWGASVKAAYEADYESRHNPNWPGSCTPPWWVPNDINCNTNIFSQAIARPKNIFWHTDKTVLPVNASDRFWCNQLFSNTYDDYGSNSNWRGEASDWCVELKPYPGIPSITQEFSTSGTGWCTGASE